MKPKVSIVIPVYNAEKYIKRCIDSLVNQTLNDIEIIVLNDGSTDKSEEIIKQYLSVDKRIIYVYHDNVGVGPTRNLGLKIATGKYIGFVDSDDEVDVTMYEKLYKEAENNNCDISICKINNIYINKYNSTSKTLKDKNYNKIIVEKNIKDKLEIVMSKYYYNTHLYTNSGCDKIFNREMLINNDIVFGDLKEITGEDAYFSINALSCANTICFLDEKLYNYYLVEDSKEKSIIHTYNKEFCTKTINLMKKFESFAVKNSLTDKYESFISSYIYNLLIGLSIEHLNNKEKYNLKKDIQLIVENEFIQENAKRIINDKNKNLFNKVIKRNLLNMFVKAIANKNVNLIYRLLHIKYCL